ncbi:MAG: NADH:ubiquinone reductase (Na(+)-transporting) subunit F [Kiritimatiellia bacterium]|jgi:Na+-transporting NADH:ubiquinone oxidoreductase subunit F|nr:NADH:ubiquinone reductase (Na(+)-transporting) subunit F [Kiritimatiellia bacterium]MDP6631303.1 NADH:ubiquinone reductase (Na(+)-transporting) subunit F [Kiritimatiellia bacterium]MDP6809634.1 NADH:ubiquinone reductase (Na(+)-transporting) subunit F [Kiritimatiellia bacterium]MDP7023515.1 NADH:ubiquinone reductase (Na(+)-transporting) subunit F [Kiritimatiellia bacterium]
MVLFVIASAAVFTGVIVLLVILLSAISAKLSPGGEVTIDVNDGKKSVTTEPGQSLLSALAGAHVFVPSACGGGGTCGMCTCKVKSGGGDILATELGFIKKPDRREGMRLACQVKLREDTEIEVPEEVLDVKKWECTVASNDNVATFIKEFVVTLPKGENLDFQAGGYIQIDIPPYKLGFTEFDVGEEYRGDWDHFKFFDLHAENDDECFRAYSMANHPAEGNRVMLNVRIATPPRGMDVPPGIASSYIFNCKPGDKVMVSGPYGEFFMKDTDREIVFVGGGAGMAPMRSHIFDLFHTRKTARKASFWYGARSKREIFYEDEFRDIEEDFDNFSFNIALSEPQPEDEWTGYVGFIHQVLLDNYLDHHKDPTEIEYYLCGPPLMLSAMQKMLYDLGVEEDMIAYDDFG